MLKHHPLIFTAALFVAFCLLTACATNRELSPSGKVLLQEAASIAVRRALIDSPRRAEKAQNIRDIAARLQNVTEQTTVSGLRAAVEQEIMKLNLEPIDHADAVSLLNICAALVADYIGRDELDADALVRVNEFIGYLVAALPPPTTV